MPIVNRIADLHGEITAWRRDIHAHPELLYDVHRTAASVAEKLKSFGCDEVVTGIGRTGVVGVIRGSKRDDSGRVIGLRADMDALPIEEANDLPYRSTVPGKMHACGHDGHTAMLLGAARYLTETRNFAGTAVVIFQPAEEGGAGGKAMVKDGLMERFHIEEVYGMHNYPGLPVGQFGLRPGPLMAAADRLTIEIEGRGGHAARPHISVDTVLVGAQIINQIQSIVSRNVDPLHAAVISICVFQAGSTDNVIPQTALLRGTARSLTPEVRDILEKRLNEVVTGTARLYGATAKLTYQRDYPSPGTMRSRRRSRPRLRPRWWDRTGSTIASPRSWAQRISRSCWRRAQVLSSLSETATARACITPPMTSMTRRSRSGPRIGSSSLKQPCPGNGRQSAISIA
jgi:hippurate hydrolase